MDLTLLIIGSITGALVGLTGAGGGAVLTPALVLGLGIPAPIAVGTDVLVAAVMKLAAGGSYARDKAVDWGLVGALALGSIPGVLAGSLLTGLLPESVTVRLIGAAVLLTGAVTTWRLVRRRHETPQSSQGLKGPGARAAATVGVVTGLLVGATSVGGGTLLLAVLAVWWPLSAKRIVGTDIAHGLLLAAVAALAHGAAGRIDLWLALPLLSGGVPAAILSARLATRIPEAALRATVAATLVLLGAGLLGEVHH